MSTAELRPIEIAHLDEVVAVHCAAFPKSAMTKLGSEAVKRYYLWQLIGPHETYPSGAWIENQLVGFCFGGVHPTAITGFIAKNKHFLAWRLLMRPWLITNQLFRDRLAAGLRILAGKAPGQKRSGTPATPHVKRPYDILSIAVHPNFQEHGIGKALLARTTQQAIDNGFTVMTLFVNRDNERAIRFYERCGWKRSNYQGVWRGTMVYSLTQDTVKSVVTQGGSSALSSA